MINNPTHNTGGNLEWFTQNLPTSYLNYPEQYLYNCALEVEEMEDIAENRSKFKALLIARKVSEGMELDSVDQKQVSEFMNPNDSELKTKRSEELVKLTQKHLEQKHEFTEASRIAFLEIFHKEAPFKIAEMDEDYFRNHELVSADLHSYLECGDGETLSDLTSSNPTFSTRILTQSGKKFRWDTYLKYASRMFFGTTFKKGNRHRISDALKKLLQVTGINVPEYVPMDEAYFSNFENIKADLQSYFQHATGEFLQDLLTTNPNTSTSVVVQSGEKIRWGVYLRRASGVLLKTKKRNSSNTHRTSEVLKKLLRIIDPTLPEYIPMDEKYFNNPENVKSDLQAYLEHAEGDLILDLNTKNPEYSISVMTQNGEMVTWDAYLKRTSGILLGTANNNVKNPHRPVEALKKLLQIIGVEITEYIPMDEKYFSNSENVKADLTSYLKHTSFNSIDQMSTRTPDASASVSTQSGEKIRWATYLNRASRVLLGTGAKKNPLNKPSKALKKLLKIADPTLPEYIPMDEAYFTNPEYVKADLTSYLKHTAFNSIDQMSTRTPDTSVSVSTQSGEKIRWDSYLNRASCVLLGTGTKKNPINKPSKALKKLLKIADPTLPEYIPMDEAYFTNPEYVKKDLHAYLQHARGDCLEDLHTKNPKPSISVLIRSGEKVRWKTYLNRASRTFFNTRAGKKSKNPNRPPEALKLLKEIAQKANDK